MKPDTFSWTPLYIFAPSGDMGSASIQTMEAFSDSEQEQEQEELGKLTEADKAHTGRVRPVRLNNNNNNNNQTHTKKQSGYPCSMKKALDTIIILKATG